VRWNGGLPHSGGCQRRKDCWVQGSLNSTDDRERDGEEEGVEESVDGFEYTDVLDQGVVPRETEHECGHENHENEEKNLGECVNRAARFGNFFNHLIHTDIFFPGVL